MEVTTTTTFMKLLLLKIRRISAFIIFLFSYVNLFGADTLITKTSTWKYLANGSNQGTSWKDTTFNDNSWSSASAIFGAGTLDGATITTSVPLGSGPQHTTYYFRKRITLTNISYSGGLDLNLLCDDGAIIYINGKEALRYNLPGGAVTYTTQASSAIGGTDEGDYTTYNVDDSFLKSGYNYIAVEIHQNGTSSSDVGFDLQVIGSTSSFTLTNGPYLQMARPTAMNVRWRTVQSHQARVWYGTSQGSLTSFATQAVNTTEHEVAITGLTPNTKYYYAIGSTTGDTIQSGVNNYFITPPTVGTSQNTRIWVLGDCGRATTLQSETRDAYYNYNAGRETDFIMLLGDNAYNSGTDNEYQTKFFDYYDSDILRKSPLWPTPGNHDYNNGGTVTPTVPYFDLFTLPTNAECGGVASGQEAYYSFDHANIHFVSLDSYGEVSAKKMYDTTGAQAIWLKSDLAATTQKWKVMFWHHPPYTKGSHNSDTESDLIALRQNFLRMVERYDVDLILCGHSHNYERSRLISGHYGSESTYDNATHAVDSSTGRYDGTVNSCPYVKSSAEHEGTVYVVAGGASQTGTTTSGYPHNAMYYSESTIGGTAVLDINGNRLDLKYLDKNGDVLDSFTIMKDVNLKQTLSLSNDSTQEITASWPGAVSWCTGAETSSITVDSSANTYIVTDGKSCLADTFVVNGGGVCENNNSGDTTPCVGWVAYNDFRNSGSSTNAAYVTTFTYNNESGFLKDSATNTNLTLHRVAGSFNRAFDPQGSGGNFNSGTDGYNLFNGRCDIKGSLELDSANDTHTITLSGLLPNKKYDIAVTYNRDNVAYANMRYTRFTIAGVDSSLNISSPGVSDSSANSVSFSTGYNTVFGYVARWTNISPGSDSTFTITSQWANALGSGGSNTKGYAASVMRLAQLCTADTSASSPQNSETAKVINGQIFLDFNANGIFEPPTEVFGAGAVEMKLYKDLDSNGVVNPSDLLSTQLSDAYGNFSFTVDTLPSYLNYQVNSGSDDIEEQVNNGTMNLTSTDIEIVYDGATIGVQSPAVRFNNIQIYPGDSILSAYLTFTAKDAGNSTDVFVNIYGFDDDNTPAFTSTNYNASSRNKTSSSARWPAVGNLPTWTTSSLYSTTELKSIVQEIVNRPGWNVFNSLGFIMEGTGTGIRRAWTYDGSAADAPKLFIHVLRSGNTAVPTHTVLSITASDLGPESRMTTDTSDLIHLSSVTDTITINYGYLGPRTQCMIIADGVSNGTSNDELYLANRITGKNQRVGVSSTFNIEAIGLMLNMDTLYAYDNDQFGFVNMQTGAFTSIGSPVGTANGIIGGVSSSRNIADVDGLSYDAINDVLYATERRSTLGENDLLFIVNRSTGSFVPNAFGSGKDFVEITGTGVKDDIDDIGLDPVTGIMYAVNNISDGDSSRMLTINYSTGVATVVGLNGVDDIEGMGYYNTGEMYGTTGNPSDTTPGRNAFYNISRSTGIANIVDSLYSGAIDPEGCDCFSGPGKNYLSGKVFWDQDSSGTFTQNDTVYSDIKMVLFRDANANNVLDHSDPRVDSMQTNSRGDYAFLVDDIDSYLVAPIIGGTILQTLKTTTSDSITEKAFFTNYGQFDGENDFGFHLTAGSNPIIPLPVTWLNVGAKWSNSDAVIFWSTGMELNNSHFEVEKLSQLNGFLTIGDVRGYANSNEVKYYSFTDSNANFDSRSQLYYRIKQVDFNGNTEYSDIIPLNTSKISNWEIYPNPFNGQLHFICKKGFSQGLTVSINNIAGIKILEKTIHPENNEKVFTIDELEALDNGLYFITIHETHSTTVFKLFKAE